jgi:hypothetical protein
MKEDPFKIVTVNSSPNIPNNHVTQSTTLQSLDKLLGRLIENQQKLDGWSYSVVEQRS